MNRYITIMDYEGNIFAFTEEEHKRGDAEDIDYSEYVWQYADSKEQAINQHCDKHDEWYAHVNTGAEEKTTY